MVGKDGEPQTDGDGEHMVYDGYFEWRENEGRCGRSETPVAMEVRCE